MTSDTNIFPPLSHDTRDARLLRHWVYFVGFIGDDPHVDEYSKAFAVPGPPPLIPANIMPLDLTRRLPEYIEGLGEFLETQPTRTFVTGYKYLGTI